MSIGKSFSDSAGRAEWFETVLAAAEGRLPPTDADKLPRFPPEELQVRTTGQAGRPTLEEAFAFYEDTALTFQREMGKPLDQGDKILDFGCGWGRILRFFTAEVGVQNCYGTDVDTKLVALCRELFRSPNFYCNGAFPPAEFDDNTFSLIVGYSVFSHLSEAACRAWMKEFYRILRPAGLVAVTTRGRWFFDYCEGLKDVKGGDSYADGLASLFPDFEEAKRSFDVGNIVHTSSDSVSGGEALGRGFYGETFIPEAWARRAFLPLMRLVGFHEAPGRQTHPILFFTPEGKGLG